MQRLFLAVLLLVCANVWAQPDAALLGELRQGGYVLYIRHASTDFSQNDAKMTRYKDCPNQRNLTDKGRTGRPRENTDRELAPIATTPTNSRQWEQELKKELIHSLGGVMRTITIACLAATLILTACATPTVVQSVKPGDSGLTCAQLQNEYADAQRFRDEADREKGMTGGNVARAILFWPAILGSFSNANEAISSADSRKVHLANLMNQRNCPVPGIAPAAALSTPAMQPTSAGDVKPN
jgi:hypothetical protein